MKLSTIILFLILLIILYFNYIYNINIKRNKYLVLIFSDTGGKPSKNFKPKGYGGLRHCESHYLIPLPKIAYFLNRKGVYPPPFCTLSAKHNNDKNVSKMNKWSDYINTKDIPNLEEKPPFKFSDNGDIITNLSKKYYKSDVSINEIDNDVDIVIFCNYKNKEKNLFMFSPLILNGYIHQKIFYKFIEQLITININTSDKIIKYVNEIIKKLNLYNFTFLHIRRGDFLDNYELAPPKGTRPYTSPEYISNIIKNKTKNKNIFIATNEKDIEYHDKIKNLLKDFRIIFEDDYKKFIPKNIYNDNYFLYQISNEIAKKANINIGTHGYLRLGNKYNFKLSDFYYNNIKKVN